VACGTTHTLAVSVDGELFAWGCGREGQLGLGDYSSPRAPQLVHLLVGQRVTSVAAGEFHSAAVTENALYTWGDGAEGQLGLQTDKELKVTMLFEAACVVVHL